ncbi:phosphoribosylglycinamide formyltransferase [Corynebacterium terpenotabidum]|uniref:Phosphoribosylglycinamide formyltransferase n=1 Tax=Corynebacterium terpenotabidum Y-11 TaxID=1200352 RepID=S4XFL1_9CORY|nr:phosphoribosylglycinamide formyltransferase [Corynebacterium terpenotabidum Y-11]
MTQVQAPATPGEPLRVIVLTSGEGTLLQSMIDDLDDTVEIVAVGADRACRALDRAAAAGTETFLVAYNPDRVADYDRTAWNRRLAEKLASYRPDIIVSAGFMRILGTDVIDPFRGRIINTHPALLPSFPGAHAVEDALAYGVALTGSTVHLVDDGVDTGPIMAQRPVPVLRGDTRASLHERIKTVERQLIVDVLHRTARNGYTIDGRKVWIND